MLLQSSPGLFALGVAIDATRVATVLLVAAGEAVLQSRTLAIVAVLGCDVTFVNT